MKHAVPVPHVCRQADAAARPKRRQPLQTHSHALAGWYTPAHAAAVPCAGQPPFLASLSTPCTPATRTQVFLYPIGGVVAILPLSILLGLSPTSLMLKWYFPGR